MWGIMMGPCVKWILSHISHHDIGTWWQHGPRWKERFDIRHRSPRAPYKISETSAREGSLNVVGVGDSKVIRFVDVPTARFIGSIG